ncbi:hypothetical protein LY78DRAFT_685312 [Colletotrichum sublineola]|uniref:Uncharacterized protein n=1 Tax=Colletotrichum sublineola TaxID=1173701 RepID=A0A066XQ55_COLSU|nr:hypothetical protein LY78DRAFT_685312 [Colletotrichum sublineola]KDN69809.1 hypothetical protein CSUB01_09717 [Colletotrichum sublineola]
MTFWGAIADHEKRWMKHQEADALTTANWPNKSATQRNGENVDSWGRDDIGQPLEESEPSWLQDVVETEDSDAEDLSIAMENSEREDSIVLDFNSKAHVPSFPTRPFFPRARAKNISTQNGIQRKEQFTAKEKTEQLATMSQVLEYEDPNVAQQATIMWLLKLMQESGIHVSDGFGGFFDEFKATQT